MFPHAETLARHTNGRALLRTMLQLDGVASGAMGVAFLAGSAFLTGGAALDEALGLPSALLWVVGAFLVPYAAALFVLASRPEINRVAAWTIVVGNLVWTVDSVLLAVAGWYDLTLLGEVIVLAQAIAVLGFAGLQYLGLRRSA